MSLDLKTHYSEFCPFVRCLQGPSPEGAYYMHVPRSVAPLHHAQHTSFLWLLESHTPTTTQNGLKQLSRKFCINLCYITCQHCENHHETSRKCNWDNSHRVKITTQHTCTSFLWQLKSLTPTTSQTVLWIETATSRIFVTQYHAIFLETCSCYREPKRACCISGKYHFTYFDYPLQPLNVIRLLVSVL